MTEYIYIKCPNCHSEYEVSLDVVSAGKSKAKCGKCHNSFVIKENMINHSFLHTYSQPEDDDYKVVESNHSDPAYDIDAEDPSFNANVQRANHTTVVESDEYGKEWTNDINEMSQDSIINEPSYAPNFNEAPNLSLNYNGAGSARTLSTELNNAPPYYVSTNKGIIDPIKHSFHKVAKKPVENRVSKSYSPYIMPALWAIGCVGLLLMLLAQYIVFNLDNLVKDPNPPINVERICRVAACALPSADLTKITLTNQQFRPLAQRPGTTAILATITNRSPQEQFYPNMKVQVYGSDGLLGDFIAKPEDYLLTPQRLIRNTQPTTFMLTVDIDSDTIRRIDIAPFY